MNAPRADTAIALACDVRIATVRAVFRHRVRPSAVDSVAVTVDEVVKFHAFERRRSARCSDPRLRSSKSSSLCAILTRPPAL